MATLPQPKRARREKEFVVVPRNVKIRRPSRGIRPSQSDLVRMLDRAIDGFVAALSTAVPTDNKRPVVKTLELIIADELGNGDGQLTASEAYDLLIEPERIVLTGTDAPALRAGLVTLAGLIVNNDGVTMANLGRITDWPDLPVRGFHLDLSCQRLKYEYICSLLERLAEWKYNAVLVEWGDKFPYQGHRILSHAEALSTRQVSLLLELSESLGLVVVPLIQTLGHVEFILRHPQFAHLSETPGDIYQLATASPESIVLAKQLVDQIIESHPNSPYIHLGADETRQLGAGLSADDVRRKGKSLAWVEYMNVLCRHVQARGRTPIVWDDMLLAHPQSLNRFTRDCILMHWNYSSTEPITRSYSQPGVGVVSAKTYAEIDPELRQRYEPFWATGGAQPPKTFNPAGPALYLQEAGFKIIHAPAVRSSGDSYAAPRLRLHIDNCVHAARTACEMGSLGVLVTNWSVRRTPIETTLPALAAAAEAAWNCQTPTKAGKLDALLTAELTRSRNGSVIETLDEIGQSGAALLNGVLGNAWDRKHERWGIAPLLARLRRAELGSLTSTSEPVKQAKALQRQAKGLVAKLARLNPSEQMHPSFAAAWRYGARELLYKADQWLFFWQLCRMVRTDRGSVATLARQGAALLEDIRKCQREFKRAVSPSLTPGGVEEEMDIHFGGEARLIRRVVRILRGKQARAQTRTQLASTLGITPAAPKTAKGSK